MSQCKKVIKKNFMTGNGPVYHWIDCCEYKGLVGWLVGV